MIEKIKKLTFDAASFETDCGTLAHELLTELGLKQVTVYMKDRDSVLHRIRHKQNNTKQTVSSHNNSRLNTLAECIAQAAKTGNIKSGYQVIPKTQNQFNHSQTIPELAVPIKFGEEVVGVIHALQYSPGEFDAFNQSAITLIAIVIGKKIGQHGGKKLDAILHSHNGGITPEHSLSGNKGHLETFPCDVDLVAVELLLIDWLKHYDQPEYKAKSKLLAFGLTAPDIDKLILDKLDSLKSDHSNRINVNLLENYLLGDDVQYNDRDPNMYLHLKTLYQRLAPLVKYLSSHLYMRMMKQPFLGSEGDSASNEALSSL